jgi:hypothetical protein
MLFKSNICSEKILGEEQAEQADASTPASRANGRYPSQEHRVGQGRRWLRQTGSPSTSTLHA